MRDDYIVLVVNRNFTVDDVSEKTGISRKYIQRLI